MTRRCERGSIVVYILIAIFLTGLLVAAMTQGAKKSANTQQLDEMMLYVQADIKAAQAAITECAQVYPEPVDIDGDGNANTTDNPNAPFPLYCADSSCVRADLTSGAGGKAITSIGCAGAPDGQRNILGTPGALKVLGDTAEFTTKYFTDTTEGVYIRITRVGTDPVWTEAISQLDKKYSKCVAAAVTSNPDPTGFNCSAGCFYYWILRRSTSSGSFEGGCP